MAEIADSELQKLQEARDIAESTVNTVREPLIILDGDLKVLSASRAFYQTFQVKSEETEHQFIYELGNKQWDIPALRKLLEGILPQNESFDNYEVEHDFPGIGKRIMLLNARRIPRPPAKPRVILLAIEDVTERRQIEKSALLVERDLYKNLFDTAQTIILNLDCKGKIVSFNPYMEHLSGYRLAEVKGKDWFSTFLPQHDYDSIRELFKKAINNISTKGNVNPIIAKDGREIYIEWYDKALRDSEGKTIGLLSVGQDITERWRLEAELREKMKEYKLMSDAAVGRELKLIEREQEVNALLQELGRPVKYK
jgi:PAS domain S-box-containing protein